MRLTGCELTSEPRGPVVAVARDSQSISNPSTVTVSRSCLFAPVFVDETELRTQVAFALRSIGSFFDRENTPTSTTVRDQPGKLNSCRYWTGQPTCGYERSESNFAADLNIDLTGPRSSDQRPILFCTRDGDPTQHRESLGNEESRRGACSI